MKLVDYKKMFLIRRFEERIQELFDDGTLNGTTHLCIGQEVIPVLMQSVTKRDDVWVSNHRSHGHYIAHTDDVEGLMLEMFGKEAGVCGGRGGSQHLSNGKTFFSNGIVGGMTPIAAGMALVEKKMETGRVVVCFLGDGALNQGVVYESLNLASLWELPIIYVIEENGYAMSTQIINSHSQFILEKIERLGDAFGIETLTFASKKFDVDAMKKVFRGCVKSIRKESAPLIITFATDRLCGHSKSDKMSYRNPLELGMNQKSDFLNVWKKRLGDKVDQVEKECNERIDKAIEEARNAEDAIIR